MCGVLAGATAAAPPAPTLRFSKSTPIESARYREAFDQVRAGADQSHLIVMGTMADTSTTWLDGHPYVLCRVRVDEVFAGTVGPDSSATFLWGGVRVNGAIRFGGRLKPPQFRQRYLLFLSRCEGQRDYARLLMREVDDPSTPIKAEPEANPRLLPIPLLLDSLRVDLTLGGLASMARRSDWVVEGEVTEVTLRGAAVVQQGRFRLRIETADRVAEGEAPWSGTEIEVTIPEIVANRSMPDSAHSAVAEPDSVVPSPERIAEARAAQSRSLGTKPRPHPTGTPPCVEVGKRYLAFLRRTANGFVLLPTGRALREITAEGVVTRVPTPNCGCRPEPSERLPLELVRAEVAGAIAPAPKGTLALPR